MPQDLPRPIPVVPQVPKAVPAAESSIERVVLHAWILAIAVALLWVLLG